MIFSEPQRTPYDLHFRVLGIPVRIHPFFWLVGLVFGASGGDASPGPVLLWIVALFISIMVHELGHALTARLFGCEPHIVLHGFGGLAIYQARFRDWRKSVLITLAGPGAGFCLAAVIVAILQAAKHPVDFEFGGLRGINFYFTRFESTQLSLFSYYMLFINIWWGLINLLPVFPLDGGQIARELLVLHDPRQGMLNSLRLSISVGAGVAVYALAKLNDGYLAMMFGYLAFLSYQALQNFTGRGGPFGRRW